jgi:hypothetical protein
VTYLHPRLAAALGHANGQVSGALFEQVFPHWRETPVESSLARQPGGWSAAAG